MFFFFSNRLGCLGSLLLSAVLTTLPDFDLACMVSHGRVPITSQEGPCRVALSRDTT